jgi:hypothetical protein
VAGSLMAQVSPPSREYTERIYRQVARYMAQQGMDASNVSAGCARCQACSAINSIAMDKPLLQIAAGGL